MTDALVILHEDPHCLAVVKPAGLLTQGRTGAEPTLEDAVRRHLRPDAPGSVYLGTVHRLDRPVSGVVVWAKTPKAARRLAARFADRSAVKHYWAVVEGDASSVPLGEAWEDWLAEVDDSGRSRLVDSRSAGARRAVTGVRAGLATRLPEGTSWLRLWPETGRTHQLRAQAAARGLPVLGDTAYGALRTFPRGIALHARALRIEHPIRHQVVTWVAPVPPAWAEAGIALPDAPPFEGDADR